MFTMESNATLGGGQIDAISTIYLVSLTPSVIGSFSVLAVSIVKWKHLKQQVHLLVQLTLADLLAALILMSTSVMNKVGSDHSVTICQYSLPLSLTFYFISFLLAVVYAWNSKNAVQGWRASPAEDEGGQNWCRRKILAIPVYAMVWLIPIAMYFAYVFSYTLKATWLRQVTDRSLSGIVRNDSKYCTSCILFLHVKAENTDPCSDPEKIDDTFIIIFLFLVVIPVMLSCSVIYYKVGKWYERHQHQDLFPVEGDGRSRRRLKSLFSTARNMVMVILFCWAPALVLGLLSAPMISKYVYQRSLFGLFIIQAASVSLQVFLNSMVYAWSRPNFTEAILGENTPLVAHDRLAFFDESLRGSS